MSTPSYEAILTDRAAMCNALQRDVNDLTARLAAAEAENARLREAMAEAVADIDECNRCGATLSARDILSDALAEPTP